MLRLIENLPVDLVGTKILGYLSLKDIVLLERACRSKESHQLFLQSIPHFPAVTLPSCQHSNISTLTWFSNKQCKLESLTVRLPASTGDNPSLHLMLQDLQVNNFIVEINSKITKESLKPIIDSNAGYKVQNIIIKGNQNKKAIEQLSACTGNVKALTIRNSKNCSNWLTADILSRWNLTNITIDECETKLTSFTAIVQSCVELTSIYLLHSINIDDSAVITIAQHCPKLETLVIEPTKLTYASLITLSERVLPSEELYIPTIPHIPTADIAKRCSHALSRIRSIYTTDPLNKNHHTAIIMLPYLTGLKRLCLYSDFESNLPLLAQYCHQLTEITVCYSGFIVEDVLSLCHANPLLQELSLLFDGGVTDTVLIELIHTCPHLHTLYLPYETDITDIGILALSEQCIGLRILSMIDCYQVTEVAVLQLIQRCRKLTRLEVSSRSLSEETWTKLDKKTQKIVSRCE